MIYRYMFAAYADDGVVYADAYDARVTTVTLSRYRDILFLYYEATEREVSPTDVVMGATRPFPDGRQWYPMPDIFHYSRPLSHEHWRRNKKKTPFVRLNRLRRDKIGSYIFYHQQYQEEYPSHGDKYGIIGFFDNYVYFYMEKPEEKDAENTVGTLATRNTPLDTWQSLMCEHFDPLPDTRKRWCRLDTVFTR